MYKSDELEKCRNAAKYFVYTLLFVKELMTILIYKFNEILIEFLNEFHVVHSGST